MPGDINTYALSLEMTLQDNATPALQAISTLASTVETQVEYLQKKMMGLAQVTAALAKNVQQSFTNLDTGMAKVSKQADTVAAAQQSASEPAIKAEKQIIEMVEEELTLRQQEQNLEREGKKGIARFDDKQRRMSSVWHKAVKKFADQNKKDYKGETLSKKELAKLDKGAQDDYQAIQKLKKGIVDLEDTHEAQVAGMPKHLMGSLKVLGGIKAGLGAVGSAVGGIASGFGKLFTAAGLQQIASAVSLTGAFTAGVMGAAQQEEQFHTINYRTIGSMREMSDAIIDDTLQLDKFGNYVRDLTRKELVDATIALREVGASSDELYALRDAGATVARTTGADIKSISQFSKTLTVATGSTKRSANMLTIMTRYGKQFGLTGNDMNAVMGKVNESAIQIGTAGPAAVEKFTKQMLKTAAAARQVGMGVDEMANIVDAMRNPLNTVALLGPESLDWSVDKRISESKKLIASQFNVVETMEKEGRMREAMIERMRLEAYTNKLGISAYGNLDKAVKTWRKEEEMAVEAPKIDAVPEDAEAEMKQYLKTTQGTMRNLELTVSRFEANLMKILSPIREWFESLMKWIADNPMAAKLIVWGVLIGAVAMAFVAMATAAVSGIASIITIYGALTAGTGVAAGATMGLVGALAGIAVLAGMVAVGLWIYKLALDWEAAEKAARKAIDETNKALADARQKMRKDAKDDMSRTITGNANLNVQTEQAKMRLNEAVKKGDRKAQAEIGRELDALTKARDKAQQEDLEKKLAKQAAIKAKAAGATEKQAQGTIAATQNAEKKAASVSADLAAQKTAVVTEDSKKEFLARSRIAALLKKDMYSKEVQTKLDEEAAKAAHTAAAATVDQAKAQIATQAQVSDETKRTALLSEGRAREAMIAQLEAEKAKQAAMAETAKKEIKMPTEPTIEIIKTVEISLSPLLGKISPAIDAVLKTLADSIEKSLSKIGPTLADVFSRGAAQIDNIVGKVSPVLKSITPEALATKLNIDASGIEKAADAFKEASRVVRPETIVTVKTDEDTAKPPPVTTTPEQKRMFELMNNQLIILGKIAEKLNPEEATAIRELLEKHLPEIAENRSGSLASSVNQW